jgi:hypothetical protein
LLLVICRIWVKISSIRSPLMTTLLGWKLGRTLLERLQPVSLKPPPSFLVLLAQKPSHTLSMSLVQLLKLLIASARGRELTTLQPVCSLPRSLVNRVLVQVLKL